MNFQFNFSFSRNSIPPTTTVDNLKVKAKVAKDKAFVDLGFWGGFTGNTNELKEMIRLGVVGFKCFLCPSGIDEFQQVTEEDVDKALTQLQGTGSLLAVNLLDFIARKREIVNNSYFQFHAEFEAADPGSGDGKDGRSYSTYLESRPENMEIEGVKLVIRQGQKHSDVRVHIVHLATADAIPLIQEARNTGGINLSVETCHHYLGLNSTMIPDGHTEYKCAPPIRDAENQEGLWKGIINGDIDQVVSDHSPSTPDVKLLLDTSVDKGNFLKAWGGIASNQLGLSLMWTNGQTHGITIPKMIKLMATKPAQLMGYEKQKGLIRDNYDADFVVWSPEEYFKVSDYEIKFKNKANPYEGRYLQGVVHNTILRGEIIYDRMDATVGTQATGELLLKTLF